MDDNVKKGYDQMLEIGDQYNNDAIFMNDLIIDFSATAEELTASIEGISRTIDDVANTVSEGASGTQTIAEMTGDIVNKIAEVQKQMKLSSESAYNLKASIGKFKI